MINDYIIKVTPRGDFKPVRRDCIESEDSISGVIDIDWKWSMAKSKMYTHNTRLIGGIRMYQYPDKSLEICDISKGEFIRPGYLKMGFIANNDLYRSYRHFENHVSHYGGVPLVNWKLGAFNTNISDRHTLIIGWTLSVGIDTPYRIRLSNTRGYLRAYFNQYERNEYVILSQPINPAYLETVEHIEILDNSFSFLAINGIPMVREGNLWVSEKPEGECVLSIKVNGDPIGPVRFRGYCYD